MKTRNVLVFPAGTEIALEIANALKDCKEVRLFGAGQDISNHGRFAYPSYHVLPHLSEAGWLDALCELCTRLSIDYVYPAYDDVIVALAQHAADIPAAIVAPSLETCEITRSKSQTYRRLANVVRVPTLYASADDVPGFPVFVKPDRGQGSAGTHKVMDRRALLDAIAQVPDAIICEYLPGVEYTVDCFSDRERGLLFAQARGRRRVRNGISVNTVTETVEGVAELAEAIGRELKLHGAWFFQLKRAASGALTLLEVAPRIAGAMATHRVIGVNFPMLSIYEHERVALDVLVNESPVEVDRALFNRYRHAIRFSVAYIDLDDTLIVRDEVNTQLVGFIFQCLNRGRKVKLITRHAGNLEETLGAYRLAGLFDEVIHVRDGASKADYIREPDAIFIDDSFSERRDVFERTRIPTFDCSMIELLTQEAVDMHEAKPQRVALPA